MSDDKNKDKTQQTKEPTYTQREFDKALTAAFEKLRELRPFIEYRSGINHQGIFEIDFKVRTGDTELGQALSEVITKMINIAHSSK